MNKKDPIKKAYDQIKPSSDLLKRTAVLMKEELHKGEQPKIKRSITIKPYVRQIGIVACLFVMIIGGLHIYNDMSPKEDPDQHYEQRDPSLKINPKIRPDDNNSSETTPNAKEDIKRPLSKVAVNIQGEITDVSADGQGFCIDDVWYKVNEDTIYEDPENKVFLVGDILSAFTEYEYEGDYIIVNIIYN